MSWPKPAPGDHTISVVVSDGAETVEAFLDVRVYHGSAAADLDDDGVPDDEDLCPEEWGLGDDGCPPFSATIGCVPARPMPEEAVTCAAQTSGEHVGESVLYDWYLDGGSVLSGSVATWTWGAATGGGHEVLVDVRGEGRSATATLALEVAGGMVDRGDRRILDRLPRLQQRDQQRRDPRLLGVALAHPERRRRAHRYVEFQRAGRVGGHGPGQRDRLVGGSATTGRPHDRGRCRGSQHGLRTGGVDGSQCALRVEGTGGDGSGSRGAHRPRSPPCRSGHQHLQQCGVGLHVDDDRASRGLDSRGGGSVHRTYRSPRRPGAPN